MSEIHYRTEFGEAHLSFWTELSPGLNKNNRSFKGILENFRKCKIMNYKFSLLFSKSKLLKLHYRNDKQNVLLSQMEMNALVFSRWSPR